MGDARHSRVPIRIWVAMLISLLTIPLPLAISKGNPFHGFDFYDEHWYSFILAYVAMTAGSVFLAGSAHVKMNGYAKKLRDKKFVWLAYGVIAASFLSMHVLRIFFRSAFDYLEGLL